MSRGNDLKAWQNGGHSENTQNAAHTRHTWSLFFTNPPQPIYHIYLHGMEAEQEEEEMVQKTVLHMPQMISDVGCGNEVLHTLLHVCDKNPVRKMCFMWGLHMKEQKRVHPRSILTWERTCDLIYPFCGPRCYVESNLNPHSTEPFASVITSQHQHVRQTGFVWISPPFNPGFFRGG